MKLVKYILLSFTVFIILILSIIFLTSDGFATASIIDLKHKDSDIFYNEYDFYNSELDKYKINDILFLPYLPQIGFGIDGDYCNYSLRLNIYKDINNNSKVIINYVTIEGLNDVHFYKINSTKDLSIEFSPYDKISYVDKNSSILLEEINNYDMKLNEHSKLKVILNVSVIKDIDEILIEELVYIFDTNIRTYLVQP